VHTGWQKAGPEAVVAELCDEPVGVRQTISYTPKTIFFEIVAALWSRVRLRRNECSYFVDFETVNEEVTQARKDRKGEQRRAMFNVCSKSLEWVLRHQGEQKHVIGWFANFRAVLIPLDCIRSTYREPQDFPESAAPCSSGERSNLHLH
jgi:hypothetical protein